MAKVPFQFVGGLPDQAKQELYRNFEEIQREIQRAATPVGMVSAYWGAAAPADWLLCNGAAIPAQYTALIALIGANTPNLKGRVIVGIDPADGDFDAVGDAGGAKTVALTEPQLASHNHTQDAHSHSHGHTVTVNATSGAGTGIQSQKHTHVGRTTTLAAVAWDGQGYPAGDVHNSFQTTDRTGQWSYTGSISDDSVDHYHGMDHGHTGSSGTDATGQTAANQAAGSGTAHSNLQPYAALAYIIKAA